MLPLRFRNIESAFLDDAMRQDAVIRQVEVVGEAARRLAPATRDALTDLPWADIIGMRNFLAHGYDAIDLEVVWKTATQDLPVVAASIRAHLDPG